MAELPKLRNPAPEVERRIHKALQADRELERTTADPDVLRMSSIGECVRNLWLARNGTPEDEEIPPRALAIFSLGNAIEAEVIRLLRKAGYVVIDRSVETGAQFELKAFDGRLVGHTDGKILLGDKRKPRECLLEIKSANARQWQVCSDVGYEAWNPKYAAQVQAYMGYSGLKESLVVVYNKDTSEVYAERIKFDPGQFAELESKVRTVLESEERPDRPALAKSQFCAFCKYCARNAFCWSSVRGMEAPPEVEESERAPEIMPLREVAS